MMAGNGKRSRERPTITNKPDRSCEVSGQPIDLDSGCISMFCIFMARLEDSLYFQAVLTVATDKQFEKAVLTVTTAHIGAGRVGSNDFLSGLNPQVRADLGRVAESRTFGSGTRRVGRKLQAGTQVLYDAHGDEIKVGRRSQGTGNI